MNDNLPPNSSSDRRAWRTDDEWNRLRERIEGADVPVAARAATARWAFMSAAVLVLAVGVYSWRLTRARDETRVVTTAAGERIVIRLADSSVVTLGPASSIRYVVGPRRREVELEGVADFNVVHDAARPFVVRAKNAVTTDLGTEFVVRAYRTDSSVDVAVREGSVSLAGTTGTKAIELRPGDVGRVTVNGTPALGRAGTASARTAWLEGRLVFHEEPLSAVADELERWFDTDIRVEGDALSRRRVSAVYNSPSLDGVLDALEATLGLRVERAGRAITISERPR